MTDLEKFSFDRLRMYFGEPFQLTDQITIYQPTIGDILEVGEADFFSNLNIFIGNPTMYRLQLWKSGIDWNKMSDFDLFSLLVNTCDLKCTKLLFGDIDFTKLQRIDIDSENIFLYDNTSKLLVTKESYQTMADYIRTMFNIFPKVEKAKGKTTKQWIIQEDEQKLLQSKEKGYSSYLLPLISACVNHPGFKYKLKELKDVGIVQFMDSVQRIQIYETAIAANHGVFSGMCDTSKMDKKILDFMRDIG